MFLPFETPTSILVSGPSQSGKTFLVRRIIDNRNEMFQVPPTKVVYAYSAWQPVFDEMKGVEFHQGLPTQQDLDEWSNPGTHLVLVLDDLMGEACSSESVMSIFTIQCHHKNITVLFLTQNVFPPGKYARSISLNSHYIILCKSKRDLLQIQTLGKQIFPGQSSFFVASYQDAVSQPFGYLVCDLHPGTDKRFQLRTRIFPDELTWIYTPYKDGETLSPWSFSSRDSESEHGRAGTALSEIPSPSICETSQTSPPE